MVGRPQKVVKMADEIGSAERAAGYVKAVLDRGGRVAGFGHPVYKTADPRSECLEQEASAVLLRPRLRYDGPVDLAYTPIDRRR